jgi:hypothetical protein
VAGAGLQAALDGGADFHAIRSFRREWISADDDDPVAVAGVGEPGWTAHHSNESSWKPKEVPLGDDRILVLDAEKTLAQRDGKLCS